MANRIPSPEQLQTDPRFELLDTLEHRNLTPQKTQTHPTQSWVTSSYWLLNLMVLGWTFFSARSFSQMCWVCLVLFCLGMCLAYFTLLPIHESIHYLAYKMLGARIANIKYELQRLTAYCTADRFVADGKRFAIVSLAPFCVINTLLVFSLFFAKGFALMPLCGALFLHVGACSGDIALVNYLWRWRGSAVYTFDDVAAGQSFFFRLR